jgi:glycosyltransferase involved in cell wall biosynthesis
VSVVIPTHSRRKLLARTLSTVLNQTGVDLEVIVVDDGSTDDTADFLESVDDPRLRVVTHDEPKGPSPSRNDGIEAARGGLLAFCDHDDLWAPSKLASQVAALEASPEAKWSCVGSVLVTGDDLRIVRAWRSPRGPDVAAAVLANNVIPGGGSGVMADAALVRELGGFDPELRLAPDWDMWTRLALASPVAVDDRPLVGYLRHNGSLTGTGMQALSDEYEYIRAKYAAEREEHGAVLWEAETKQWVADAHARAGRRWPAVRRYARIAARYRSTSAAKRGAAVLVSPRLISLVDRTERKRIPADWMTEADAWLAPYREPAGAA